MLAMGCFCWNWPVAIIIGFSSSLFLMPVSLCELLLVFLCEDFSSDSLLFGTFGLYPCLADETGICNLAVRP